MMKVWLMVAFMHSPEMPSVRYNAVLFETEEICMENLVVFKSTALYLTDGISGDTI